MTILQNSVDSIRLGLEDLDNAAPGRHLSAVRNLFAGILLLFKEKLRRSSPPGSDEVLLYTDVTVELEDGNLSIKPKKPGKAQPARRPRKTVDTAEIEHRFEVLAVQADWDRVYKLQEIRNDIEHRFSAATTETMREVVASTFLVIRDFLDRELGEHPAELLGDAVWQRLLDHGEVYEAESAECELSFTDGAWPSEYVLDAARDHRCEDCRGNLVVVLNPQIDALDRGMQCRSCRREVPLAHVAELGLRLRFRENAYLIARAKTSAALDDCPGCECRTYVLEDERCALCEYEPEYRKCYLCGGEVQLDEQELDGLCGGCAHSAEKSLED